MQPCAQGMASMFLIVRAWGREAKGPSLSVPVSGLCHRSQVLVLHLYASPVGSVPAEWAELRWAGSGLCLLPLQMSRLGDQASRGSPWQPLPFLRLGQIRNGKCLGPFLAGWPWLCSLLPAGGSGEVSGLSQPCPNQSCRTDWGAGWQVKRGQHAEGLEDRPLGCGLGWSHVRPSCWLRAGNAREALPHSGLLAGGGGRGREGTILCPRQGC